MVVGSGSGKPAAAERGVEEGPRLLKEESVRVEGCETGRSLLETIPQSIDTHRLILDSWKSYDENRHEMRKLQ